MRSSIALSFVFLAVLAAATPTPVPAPASTCSTGPVQCCQSLEQANSVKGQAILGLLNIVLQDLNVMLGLTCSPLTVIGVGTGNECSSNAVCCDNNNVGGLISIGCLPIII